MDEMPRGILALKFPILGKGASVGCNSKHPSAASVSLAKLLSLPLLLELDAAVSFSLEQVVFSGVVGLNLAISQEVFLGLDR